MRVGIASVVSAVMVLLLGGCWTLPNQLQGPLAIQLQGGLISLAVCEDITATSVWGETSKTDPIEQFWDAKAATEDGVEVRQGTIIDAENVSDFFPLVTNNSTPIMGSDSGILIFVESVNGVEENFSAAFRLHGLTDTGGKWFHPDGSFTLGPCG